jgi:hypothetical protein
MNINIEMYMPTGRTDDGLLDGWKQHAFQVDAFLPKHINTKALPHIERSGNGAQKGRSLSQRQSNQVQITHLNLIQVVLICSLGTYLSLMN